MRRAAGHSSEQLELHNFGIANFAMLDCAGLLHRPYIRKSSRIWSKMGDIEHGTSEGPHVEMIQKYERNIGSMTRKAQVFGMG